MGDDRWAYTNEGPVDFESVANVKGEDPADVWFDLLDGIEDDLIPHRDGERVVYECYPVMPDGDRPLAR